MPSGADRFSTAWESESEQAMDFEQKLTRITKERAQNSSFSSFASVELPGRSGLLVPRERRREQEPDVRTN